MKILLALSAVAGTAVGIYGAVSSRAVPSAVFLGLSAFSLVMVLGLLGRAARALVEEGGDTSVATGRRKKELEREKLAVLKALKELEFDHEMRKISDADFRDIGGQYRARAMRILRQLDEQGADYKALVEKELKARMGLPQKPRPDLCAACGTANDNDAVFCKKCGKKVAA